MKKSIATILRALSIGATLGLIAAAPSTVFAKWQRYNSAFCATEFGLGTNGAFNEVGYGGGLFGVMNLDANWQLSAVCPIDDSSAYHKGEIVGVNVHVHNNNAASSTHARACTKNFGSWDHHCGNAVQTSVVGNVALQPPVGVYGTWSGDFAYVLVTLAKRNTAIGSGWSSLHGYFTFTN